MALNVLYISDCDKFSPLLEKLTAPDAADNKDFQNDASESDSDYFEEDEDKQPAVVGGASDLLFHGLISRLWNIHQEDHIVVEELDEPDLDTAVQPPLCSDVVCGARKKCFSREGGACSLYISNCSTNACCFYSG